MTIRDVHDAAGLRACQVLQREVWGITEDGYVLPVATMAGAQQVGGLVLGAFDPASVWSASRLPSWASSAVS